MTSKVAHVAIVIVIVIVIVLLYKLFEELSLFLGVLLAENCQQVFSTLCHWRLDCLPIKVVRMMMRIRMRRIFDMHQFQ